MKQMERYKVQAGSFEDGLPFARMGDKSKILVDIEALSFKHEPPSGFMLKRFIKAHSLLAEDYTVFAIGRRPNLPDDYLFDKMAADYARVIRREFKGPVDVIGVSTGGQIAQYLAADHPDTVRKLGIISAAYRISEQGAAIERKSGEFFKIGKHGKSFAAIMELVYPPGVKRNLLKFIMGLVGKGIIGNIEHPNDYLVEIRADREMNFKDRLKDIKAPTLIMSGELDICYTVEDVRVTAGGIPNAELNLYKGYGHDLDIRNLRQVQEDLLRFLRK
jgi:pimeloyl-ACP methyl ester carboxylesterase